MKLRIALLVVMLTPALLLVGCGSDSNNGVQPDTTPPLAPVIVGARGADGAVGIWWLKGNEPDLAGYHVYVVDHGILHRATKQLMTENRFVQNVGHAGSVSLYVTSMDYSGNESGPSESHWVRLDSDDKTSGNEGKIVEEYSF